MRMKTCGHLKNLPEPDRLWWVKIFLRRGRGTTRSIPVVLKRSLGFSPWSFPVASRTPPFLVSLGARLCIRYVPNIVLVRYVAWYMQVA